MARGGARRQEPLHTQGCLDKDAPCHRQAAVACVVLATCQECGPATVVIAVAPVRSTGWKCCRAPGPQAEKDLAKRQSNFDAAKNIRPEIIQLGMESAISSGNWTIKRFRMERKGVSQVHTLPEGLVMSCTDICRNMQTLAVMLLLGHACITHV